MLMGRYALLFLLVFGSAAGQRSLAGEVKERTTLNAQVPVNALAFSPDGKTLATGHGPVGAVGWVKLWDVATGKVKATLEGHTSIVLTVAFSPDGDTLASAGQDGAVKLWDVTTGKEKATLRGQGGWVLAVVFAPDGKTLAWGEQGGAIRLWDLSTGRVQVTLRGHEDAVRSLAFSPDGKTLASGGGHWSREDRPGEVKLWDLAAGKERADLKGHPDYVYAVAFTADGRTLASGSRDGTLKVWDAMTGRERFTHKGKTAVMSLAFTPGGETLLTGRGLSNQAGTVTARDVTTGREGTTLKESMNGMFGVAITRDGTMWAAGSQDGTATLWDVPKEK
jgi:WD40 repeat protein